MFKNRKLEVRLVKDTPAKNDNAPEETTGITLREAIAIQTMESMAKKFLVGTVVGIAAVVAIVVVANAADTILQNAINGE